MRFLAFPALILTLALGSASAQIYADFETSLGNFTCELNYTAAPKTVANFVGLAEGTKAWLDPSTGSLRENTPFYNGLIFHRVIADFMNQGGCPLGTGSGSPGYVFPDETSNGLIHEPYVISMANSGPHTNGSQFFITVPRIAPNNFLHLNGVHTIFGTVTTGRDVIDLINDVPVANNGTSRPTTPVVIQRVLIRRIGSAAFAFNTNAQGLPVVSSLACSVQVSPRQKVDLMLPLSQPLGSVINVFRSPDLNQWSAGSPIYREPGYPESSIVTIDEEDPETPEIELLPKAFYNPSIVTYSDAFSPDHVGGRTLSLTNGANNFTFSFNADGQTGIFASNIAANSPITEVSLSVGIYRTILIIYTQAYAPFRVIASTSSVNATHFTGTETFEQYQYGTGTWSSFGSGTFTLSK